MGSNLLYTLVISLCGDVEVNPGPRTKANNSFLVFHWNINSISANNFSKVCLLRTYLTVHKSDMVCLSETYLDFNRLSNTAHNCNLEISGCNLIRSDHPFNNKREGVCIYYKNFFHLRVFEIQYLHECINIEPKIGDKFCYINYFVYIAKPIAR